MKKITRTKLIAFFMAAGMAAAGATGTVAAAAETTPNTEAEINVTAAGDITPAETTDETGTEAEEPTETPAEETALAWTSAEARPEQSETVTVAPGTPEQQTEETEEEAETPAQDEEIPSGSETEAPAEETPAEDNTNWDVFYDEETDTFNLTYNIAEGAEGDQVVDLTNALNYLSAYTNHKVDGYNQRIESGEDYWDVYNEYYDFIQGNTSNVLLPGDNRKYNISITTDSKHTYKYKDGSFILATPDLTNDDNTGVTAFDGQELPTAYAGSNQFQLASSSAPIKALLMDALHWDKFDATNKNYISYSESQTLIQYIKEGYPEVESIQNATDFTAVLQAYLLHYYSEKDGKTYTDFAKMITESKAANNELYTGTQSNRKLQVQKFSVTNTTVANKLVTEAVGTSNGSAYVTAIRDLVNELTGGSYGTTYNTLTKLRNALISDGKTDLADLITASTSTAPSTSITVPVYLNLYEMVNESGSAYTAFLALSGYNAEDFTVSGSITDKYNATAMTAGGYYPTAPLDPSQNFNNFYQNLLSFTYGDAAEKDGKLTIGGMDVSRPSWNSDKTDAVNPADTETIGSATVGEYMQMANDATWNKVNAYFQTLLKNGLTAEDAAKQAYNFYMAFNVDGELTGNSYQLSKWSWYNSFTLEQMDGKFELEKADDKGNKITENETTFQIWYYDDANENGIYDEGDSKYFYTAAKDAEGNTVYGFVQYNENNHELTYTIDTTNGELKIDYAMLKDMIYYLQEVAAPEGYDVDMKVYVICDESSYAKAVAMYASELDLAPADLEELDAIDWLGKIDPKSTLQVQFVNTAHNTIIPDEEDEPETPEDSETPEDPKTPDTPEEETPELPDEPQNTDVTEEETAEDPEIETTEDTEDLETDNETPDVENETETPEAEPEEAGGYVKTGDNTNIAPYIVLTTAATAASGAGIVALVYYRRKHQN